MINLLHTELLALFIFWFREQKLPCIAILLIFKTGVFHSFFYLLDGWNATAVLHQYLGLECARTLLAVINLGALCEVHKRFGKLHQEYHDAKRYFS